MDKIYKLLHLAFYVVVFFLAITVLYILYHRFDKMVNLSISKVAEDNMLYEEYLPETTHDTNQSELITLLMNELDYDLEVIDQVGTYTITAIGYKPEDIAKYNLTNTIYEKSYVYNLNGTISKIIFKYKE